MRVILKSKSRVNMPIMFIINYLRGETDRNQNVRVHVFYDTILRFSIRIRKIIYTTNTIENLNGKIRKYTRNKMPFQTDEALMKSVFLAIGVVTKIWRNCPIVHWGIILGQFSIIFEERLEHL